MPSLFPSIRYGGDYNPDQWPREVWDDDVRLMQKAGVSTATVGVFSWARLEPRPGEFDFEWLDDVMDRLYAGGIRVCLATATASPPPWLAKLHPETLPVDENGITLAVGSRQQYSPSSPVYKEYAVRLATKLAERYGNHPALESWHINNEYGCHVSRSYDAAATAAFRDWLAKKYGSIAALNHAWGTSFWSQGYSSFDEIPAPTKAPTFRNPTHMLDFQRFSSDAMLDLYLAELAVLRRLTPNVPVTTNFMGFFTGADYWRWAPHLDFITDDAYPDPADAHTYVEAAARRDLMRSLGGGRPWLLMEQATSAVNWRRHNAAKPAGMNRLHSLQAVARGADGIQYFQWRQAKAGAEKFHSAMVPHGGEHTRVFREVAALGAELRELSPSVLGLGVPASVAIVFDWDALWATSQEATPTALDYVQLVQAWYAGFLRRGVTVDFVRPGQNLSAYALVVAPVLQAASAADLANLAGYAAAGGTLVVTYQSGVLDENLHVYLGGYLGGQGSPLQQALGVHVEEFTPLHGSDGFAAPSGAHVDGEFSGDCEIWQEVVINDDAEVLATFTDGPSAGQPAITRRDVQVVEPVESTTPLVKPVALTEPDEVKPDNPVVEAAHRAGLETTTTGSAWYVATQPSDALLDKLVDRWLSDTGVTALFAEPTPGAEAVQRGDLIFLLNHTDAQRTLTVQGCSHSIGPYGVEILGATSANPASFASADETSLPKSPMLTTDALSPQPWGNPIVLQRADPSILLHDGQYYFTGSHPAYDRIVLRKADSLDKLQATPEVDIWTKPQTGPQGGLIWAPEIHRINDKWYIYYAASPAGDPHAERTDATSHRIYVLECADADPLTGTWVERGKVDTGWETFALDATSFERDGVQYLVWAQIDHNIEGNSNLYIARMANPWTLASAAVLLTKPEYAWEKERFWVNEGPSVLQRAGRIYLTYSAAGTGPEYAMGVLIADADADLLNTASWHKSPTPVFVSDPDVHQYGPGHNSFTQTPDGDVVLVYHSRSYPEIIGDPLYDPNRHASAQILPFGADGRPAWGTPAPLTRPVPTSTEVLNPNPTRGLN